MERQGRLRKWFGPSREEMWRKLAAEIEGQYVDGGFWGGDKVVASHAEWTITLDTHAVQAGKTTLVYTRLRAPYVNAEEFRFTVSRAGMFTELAKWFGMQDVTVGHEAFDRDFVIKGNDEERLRALFANARLRELISAQPEIHFGIRGGDEWLGHKLPPDVDELQFMVLGVVKDVERLKGLYDLLAETLDALCHIGAAYERAPELKTQ